MNEYLTWVEKYPTQDIKQQLENPAHHIHGGRMDLKSLPMKVSIKLGIKMNGRIMKQGKPPYKNRQTI